MGRTSRHRIHLGAVYEGDGRCRFLVWAPLAERVELHLLTPTPRRVPMTPIGDGYFQCVADAVPGTRYWYRLNGCEDRPDPASRFQPEGVHGPSQVVDPSFAWSDREWFGLPLADYVIYELHVGTFTPEGTFAAIIPRLEALRHLGVTAIELMPVAQFPGERNWGYDGVYPFAVQGSYGGPEQLRRLVDACHRHGLAVILDVVYNHLGPEGNYLGDYGPYFTHRYPTPWGQAINYDGPDSDPVRHFFISNALYWVTEYHIDALRLDAIHGIFDFSAKHILQELGEAVHEQAHRLRRTIHVIAESDLNDARVITPIRKGGYGLDAQWSDDFHHALHCLLTGEQNGYYEDFGKLDHLATAIQDHFVYSGQYSTHRKRRHGNSAKNASPTQFVVFAQNHDQVGNRAHGDRLSTLVPFEALKLAAAAVLLSPNIPLVFMGEEYGETAPFLYFIDHGDPGLIEAVRQGRKTEFASFGWRDVPDPYAQSTFDRSHLQWPSITSTPHDLLLHWHRALITLRKTHPALGAGHKTDTLKVQAHAKANTLTIHRASRSGAEALLILSVNKRPTSLTITRPAGRWHLALDSDAPTFGGAHEFPAPQHFTLSEETVSLDLPAYAAWIYTSNRKGHI